MATEDTVLDQLIVEALVGGGFGKVDQVLVEALVRGGFGKVDQVLVEALVDFIDQTPGSGTAQTAQILTTALVGAVSPSTNTRQISQILTTALVGDRRDRQISQILTTALVGPQSAFQQLLLDPARGRVFLIDLSPYDLINAQETKEEFSYGSRIPFYGSREWPALAVDAFNYTENVFQSDEALGGVASVSFGNVGVLWGEGDFDHLANLSWDGRRIQILVGDEDAPFTDFEPVFTGVVEDFFWNRNRFDLSIRQQGAELDKELNIGVYDGTGGPSTTGVATLGGDPELEGTTKPLCFGMVRNMTPVTINAGMSLYQVHDGSVKSIKVYDAGVDLPVVADVPLDTLLDFAQNPPDGHTWTTLSAGLFKSNVNADQVTITADVEGDNADPNIVGGYPQLAGQIIRRILLNHTEMAADLDLFTFQQLDSVSPFTLGFHVPAGQSVPARQAINEILSSVLGFFTFNRLGQIQLGRIAFGPPVVTLEEVDILEISRDRTAIPAYKYRVGYRRNWTPGTEVRESVAAPQLFTEEYRFREFQLIAAKVAHKLARTLEVNTLIESKTHATAYALHLRSLFGIQRHLLRVRVVDKQFLIHAGDTVKIKLPRYGLSQGKDFIVIGLVEDSTTKITELTLWG